MNAYCRALGIRRNDPVFYLPNGLLIEQDHADRTRVRTFTVKEWMGAASLTARAVSVGARVHSAYEARSDGFVVNPVRGGGVRGGNEVKQATPRLAKAWWVNRRPGGLFEDRDRMTKAEIDAAFRVEHAVSALVLDVGTLPKLLAELAAAAETPEELAFLGTSILEDAQRALGVAALNALESSGIESSTMDVIKSGYWDPL